jgi:hypothetical protein
MELVLQDTISNSGSSMIIVHAKHVMSNRTATLFSIVCRPGYPYPVTIQPRDEDLPDFLKKSYYVPASNFLVAQIGTSSPKQVLNQWVSDTPPEFRKKLAEAFNLGTIKSEILNLASSVSGSADNINEHAPEDWAEN